jgi:hypothetical protein
MKGRNLPTKQHTHTHIDKIRFIIYDYSTPCFGRFCDKHQGVIQNVNNMQTTAHPDDGRKSDQNVSVNSNT